MTIHLNLAVGTIGTYAKSVPELQQLCADMMDCKTMYAFSYLPIQLTLTCYSGQFLMTEAGHGLDAVNLETTCTLQPDGSFLVNSPNSCASKFVYSG